MGKQRNRWVLTPKRVYCPLFTLNSLCSGPFLLPFSFQKVPFFPAPSFTVIHPSKPSMHPRRLPSSRWPHLCIGSSSCSLGAHSQHYTPECSQRWFCPAVRAWWCGGMPETLIPCVILSNLPSFSGPCLRLHEVLSKNGLNSSTYLSESLQRLNEMAIAQ